MARPRTTSDEAILAATARAVGRHGIGQLTLATVADEAGLAPPTLVQRFGSKRGLLLAFARDTAGGSRQVFVSERHADRSPLEVLHAALARLTEGVRTPEEMANHLSVLQLDLTDPAFREHAATQVHAVRGEIAALLAEAVAEGELTASTDTGRLARTVHATYNGVLIVWGLTGTGSLPETLRAELDHVLDPYRT